MIRKLLAKLRKQARPLTKEEVREIIDSVMREGDNVAARLEIGAAFHYGLETDMSKFNPAQISEDFARGERSFPFVHSPEERARRANIPYTSFGSTFISFEEVHRVTILLHQRYTRKVLGSDEEIARIVATLLAEVRLTGT